MIIPEKTIIVEGNAAQKEKSKTDDSAAKETSEPVVIKQVDYGTYGDDYIVVAMKKAHVQKGMFRGFLVVLGGGLVIFSKKQKQTNTYTKQLKTIENENQLFELFAKFIYEYHHISIKSLSVEDIEKVIDRKRYKETLDLIDYFAVNRFKDKLALNDLLKKVENIFSESE